MRDRSLEPRQFAATAAASFSLLLIAAAAACGDGPEFPAVRDLRPATLEVGDTLVVELDPAVAVRVGKPTWVELTRIADSDTPETPLKLTARATAPRRVLVDIDQRVADQVGGHLSVDVSVAVVQEGARLESGERPWRLNLFPSTVRKLALHLVDQAEQDAFLDWLGIHVEPTTLPPDNTPTLALVDVREGFPGLTWMNRYECGHWLEQESRCKGGPDFIVHWGEAMRGGYAAESQAEFARLDADKNGAISAEEAKAGERPQLLELYDLCAWLDGQCAGDSGPDGQLQWDEALAAGFSHERNTFDRVDHNGDGAIDRHEAEQAESEPSPAAEAGIRTGDIVVSVAGQPVASAADLMQAWKSQSVDVPLTVQRAGNVVELVAPRHGQAAGIPRGFLLAGILVAVGLLVILPVPVLGGLIVVWERKISGYIQSRPGPNRVGPNGWLQWLADGVKLIVKEDIIPSAADPILFRVSPFLVFTGVFATFVVLPFSPLVQVADLNVGVLYLLSVTSIVVVGVIMGGWASNSKWSLLGGMRSAAQIISYELPASVAVLVVVVMVGSLSTQDMVLSQGGLPWQWNVFHNPFSFVCFFIFFISALAEGNRTPFDLPEAESELVAGYNTEYSGFRFSIFALAEWVNLIVIGAVSATIFLGGWNIPFVDASSIDGSLLWQIVAFGIFAAKVVAIIFVCIWIRWTLPRFRVDHMMNMCWKYFLPFALVSLVAVSLWIWILPASVQTALSLVVFGIGGVGVAVLFITRVLYVRRTTQVWDLRGA